jgi:hypothetical protein
MGHLSPTGAGMLCPQGRVDLLAGGRAWWRRVLPLLRDNEGLQHWGAPPRLRLPDTDAVILPEQARLTAMPEVLAAVTQDPRHGDHARRG